MVEKLAQNNVCENCQADVRLNALFCYNCGSQVATDEEAAEVSRNEANVGSALNSESAERSKTPESSPGKRRKAVAASSIKTDPKSNPKQERMKRVGLESQPEGLKTAASLKRGPNPFLRKQVEVTWERPDSAPNLWFLIVSVILIGFSLLVLFIMLYIK